MPETQEIVINTGPMIAIVAALGSLDVLKIYRRVCVPLDVSNEITTGESSRFAALEFESAHWLEKWKQPLSLSAMLLNSLDVGEASVIQLALNEQIRTVCIDESAGRRLARLNGLLVTGSVGILLRTMSHPPLNWGNASTWDGFLWLVSGRLYQDELLLVTLASLWTRTQSSAALLIAQFGIIGVFLGLVGLIVFFSNSRLYWNMLWVTIAFSVFSVFYVTRDSQVYLLSVVLCFSIWIGLAIGRLMQKWSAGRISIPALFAAWLIFSAIQTWPRVDLARDVQADQFGQSVLAQAPKDAILFAKGDEAVFTLWYFHYALRERPDVVVVASDLLHFDWYQETLRATYPALIVPGPLPFGETVRLANPARPACYVQYPLESGLQCLPPAK